MTLSSSPGESKVQKAHPKKTIRCSFCGRSKDNGVRLIEGADGAVYICNSCVGLCVDILEADALENAPSSSVPSTGGEL